MDTMTDYYIGQASKGNTGKVFDWNKAANLIKEHNIQNAEAGLAEDFANTCGDILLDGEPVSDDYAFLASTWATPILRDRDNATSYDCYVYETPEDNPFGFTEDSKWAGDSLK